MREAAEVLEDFMRFPAAVARTMSFLELDGYLTAICVGPGSLHPVERIADLWPGELACYDHETMRQMARAIVPHFARIMRQLGGPAKDYRPLYLPNDPAQPPAIERASEWSQGFWKAMMRDAGWRRLINDKNARYLLVPMLVFAKDSKGNALFGHTRGELESMLDGLADTVSECILRIQDYHLEHSLQNVSCNGLPRFGRNDPCFCGSGKKYKRCCGAN